MKTCTSKHGRSPRGVLLPVLSAIFLTVSNLSAMKPAPARAAVCPHCSAEKPLMLIASGNTFGATFWTDMKVEAPMLPRVSPVQRCPKCRHYFLLKELAEREEKEYSSELGWLSFAEAREALDESKNWKLDDKDSVLVRMVVVWAYDDILRKGETPTPEETAAFTVIAKETAALATEKLLSAELYRESGDFKRCLEILEEIGDKNPNLERVVKVIRDAATASFSLVLTY